MANSNIKNVEWNNVIEAIEECYSLGWSDGLPVVPPEKSRVQEFVDFVGRDPDEILGEVPERRREVTLLKVAANAVMAGCLPEYFPVVISATEAMLTDEFNLIAPSSSQGGAGILVVVNGPVSRNINMNSKDNVFGPGNRANATIGRAVRLILMNACASIPGLFDRTNIGHPGKYTYCIAENELETHWNPLHVERGFSREQSTATVFAAWEPRQVRSASEKYAALDSLIDVASTLGTSLANDDSVADGGPLVRQGQILLTMAGASEFWSDWSKNDIRDYVYPRIRRSVGDLKRVKAISGNYVEGDDDRYVQLVPEPEDILIVYAGSPEAAAYRSAVIHSELPKVSSTAVTREIVETN